MSFYVFKMLLQSCLVKYQTVWWERWSIKLYGLLRTKIIEELSSLVIKELSSLGHLQLTTDSVIATNFSFANRFRIRNHYTENDSRLLKRRMCDALFHLHFQHQYACKQASTAQTRWWKEQCEKPRKCLAKPTESESNGLPSCPAKLYINLTQKRD